MSLNESDHLEFRGKTLKECEEFIAAVNKHARDQGKIRDDQWIADFVAVCLAEDALRWWSLLDEETQGSWRRLRQAMISKFWPLLHGTSGAEAEEFVLEIRHTALKMGKLNDPRWTAEFASTQFRGTALRWYTSLDSSVRGDWDLLQQAIFTQYTHEFKEDSTAAFTPTPPFAAAPPVTAKDRQRGRIRVSKQNDFATYYLSKITTYPGLIDVTSTIAEALEVEYESASTSDALLMLTIPDDQIKGCNQLGLKWSGRDIADEGAGYLVICGVDSKSGIASITTIYIGPVVATPWRMSLSGNNRGVKSITAVHESGQPLFPKPHPGLSSHVLFRPRNTPIEPDVELFFEPL